MQKLAMEFHRVLCWEPNLSTSYMLPLGNIIVRYSIHFHYYADDTLALFNHVLPYNIKCLEATAVMNWHFINKIAFN